jgi:hypothetical protein
MRIRILETPALLVTAFLLSGTLGARPAAAAGFGLTLEPIIGYERVQKLIPDPHYTTRMLYGARMTFGFLILSVEGELTRSNDEEAFTSQDLATKDVTDKLRAGLRSGFRMGSLLQLHIRGGGQASRNHHEETRAGVTSTSEDPLVVKPYLGAGLRAALAPKIYGTAEVVTVIRDLNDLQQNEYQLTAGFSIRLP